MGLHEALIVVGQSSLNHIKLPVLTILNVKFVDFQTSVYSD